MSIICFTKLIGCFLFQQYIDSLSVAEAEDSSYDSDGDADDSHEQVSRTTSDTLGQEFAEYVSQPLLNQVIQFIINRCH